MRKLTHLHPCVKKRLLGMLFMKFEQERKGATKSVFIWIPLKKKCVFGLVVKNKLF